MGGPRLETDPDDPVRLVTDASGIARGGIRTGWVDVPAAVLSGLAPGGTAGLEVLLGTTRVFEDAELARRYPGGQAEYAAAFRAATSRAVADGFVLAEDADEMVAVAAAGYPPGCLTLCNDIHADRAARSCITSLTTTRHGRS